MLVNRLDSPYRPSHHKQWSHQQNRSGVPLCRYRDSRKVVAVGVRRGSRTWSAVSRCKQRKLQTITRQHTAAPVTLVQTLPCDPINSFNGEWSVLLTRVKKRERYHSCWATIKKTTTHTLNSCNRDFSGFAISFQHFLCCTVGFHLGLFDRVAERFTVARRCWLSQMLLARIKGPAAPSEAFAPNAMLQFIGG